uniref:Uncharacterized protein n=1 Tax=Candidatus Kentrum sp. TC TaxID=2126339 RepID=A0A451A7S1_9GAMM|nr:MAG: hypothetical protein BECKTC1821F_GA0114240_106810 [Candidatus Kentron sp. TC]
MDNCGIRLKDWNTNPMRAPPPGRPVQATQDIEERRFPGAGRTGDGLESPGAEFRRDPIQGTHDGIPDAVVAFEVFDASGGHGYHRLDSNPSGEVISNISSRVEAVRKPASRAFSAMPRSQSTSARILPSPPCLGVREKTPENAPRAFAAVRWTPVSPGFSPPPGPRD